MASFQRDFFLRTLIANLINQSKAFFQQSLEISGYDILYGAHLPYISTKIKRKDQSVKRRVPDMGLTNSQINGVVSIHKNSWWICLLCRQRRNCRDHGIFPICPKVKVAPVRHMTPNIWKVAVADGVWGKWQIGPGLGVPGEELTKSLVAAGRRSLAASPRAKITLRGPPLARVAKV